MLFSSRRFLHSILQSTFQLMFESQVEEREGWKDGVIFLELNSLTAFFSNRFSEAKKRLSLPYYLSKEGIEGGIARGNLQAFIWKVGLFLGCFLQGILLGEVFILPLAKH